MGRGWAAGGTAAVTVWLEVGGKKVRVELAGSLGGGVVDGPMECSIDGRVVNALGHKEGHKGGSTGAFLMATAW